MRHDRTWLPASLALAAILVLPGCGDRAAESPTPAATTAPTAQFATPEEAVAALVAALEGRDRAEFARLLGPDTDALLSSGDAVLDSTARATFLARYQAKNQLVSGGPDDMILQVGEDDWPLPVPLVRIGGQWSFDGAAGVREIVMRRIGANELRTIDVMRGFVVAQEEYAAKPHDGVPAGTYAQTFRSEPGKQNGLYWEVAAGQPESPAGPFLANASAEGYAAQGAGDYVTDGRLTHGYALLAWPANHGASGVMTFLVNQDGVVFQRDLGEGTEQAAAAITTFDPDSTWTPIPEEE